MISKFLKARKQAALEKYVVMRLRSEFSPWTLDVVKNVAIDLRKYIRENGGPEKDVRLCFCMSALHCDRQTYQGEHVFSITTLVSRLNRHVDAPGKMNPIWNDSFWDDEGWFKRVSLLNTIISTIEKTERLTTKNT